MQEIMHIPNTFCCHLRIIIIFLDKSFRLGPGVFVKRWVDGKCIAAHWVWVMFVARCQCCSENMIVVSLMWLNPSSKIQRHPSWVYCVTSAMLPMMTELSLSEPCIQGLLKQHVCLRQLSVKVLTVQTKWPVPLWDLITDQCWSGRALSLVSFEVKIYVTMEFTLPWWHCEDKYFCVGMQSMSCTFSIHRWFHWKHSNWSTNHLRPNGTCPTDLMFFWQMLGSSGCFRPTWERLSSAERGNVQNDFTDTCSHGKVTFSAVSIQLWWGSCVTSDDKVIPVRFLYRMTKTARQSEATYTSQNVAQVSVITDLLKGTLQGQLELFADNFVLALNSRFWAEL